MESSQPAFKQVIAVINSNEDTVEMLRTCLNTHGFASVVTAHVREIRDGATDFLEFVRTHQPQLFVYDISIPYDRNWRFLEFLRTSEVMKGRPVVVTTTNKAALEKMVGPNAAMEIVGKPYDIELIVGAVKRTLGLGES